MAPQYKYGIIFGLAGLVLNLLLAPIVAVCTPLVSLFCGALAGFFTARQADLPLQRMGGQLGALAGSLSGGIILSGQAVGAVIAVAIFQGGIGDLASYIPSTNDPLWLQMFTLSSSFGVAACFGLSGAFLAGVAGAGIGYFTTTGG